MRVIDPGHKFELQNYGPGGSRAKFHEELSFRKEIGDKFPGNTGSPHEGTNCQEVLRATISRVLYLDQQNSCLENIHILEHLREALKLFEIRAARIKGQDIHEVMKKECFP